MFKMPYLTSTVHYSLSLNFSFLIRDGFRGTCIVVEGLLGSCKLAKYRF